MLPGVMPSKGLMAHLVLTLQTRRIIIEPQIMRRFCQHQMILSIDLLNDFDMGIIPLYERTCTNSNKMVGDSLYLLHYAIDTLSTITSFSITDRDQKVISPGSSLYERNYECRGPV